MKYPLKAFTDAIETLLRDPDKRVVTLFVPPKADCKHRVRVVRRHKYRANRNGEELIVTYGKPNYAEREFLALCKKAKCNPRRMW
jgi:hypothetical protein